MQDKIAIILPFKEFFDQRKSGAAAIFVKESLSDQNLNKYIIYGTGLSRVENKYKKNFIKYTNKSKYFTNYKYINFFIKKYENTGLNNFEIHNRPEYAIYIKQKFKNSKIIIYFHNDPNELRGCENLEKKKYLYKNFKLVFLSKWIEEQFFKNTKLKKNKNAVIYPGSKKIFVKKKRNIIFFCGKLNKSKGYDIFISAIEKLLSQDEFKDWMAISAGSESRRNIRLSRYVKELGQISNKEVENIYIKSSISVAPSQWNEPLGRLPIESSSKMCVPITSSKGGLLETNLDGFVLKKNNIDELYKILKSLCESKRKLSFYQKKVYRNFKFTNKIFQKKINKLRDEYFHPKLTFSKILYISNFNFKSKDRLFYSYANKIKLGFEEKKIKTDFISDREFLRENRSLLDSSGEKKFNNLIINKFNKNKYDLLVLGHTKKIKLETFSIIKQINPNIKIIKLFIDSLSKEFFKFKDVFYDYDYLDKIFVTSDPKIIPSYYRYKFCFIPYPVHKKIDFLKSYSQKRKKYDVFFALSHGQNRAVLKKGRVDEREKLIKKIKYHLDKANISTLFVGLNNIEPRWGMDFYRTLLDSKITLNISRGKYKELYSSDRIASLSGNGCFILNENSNRYSKLFNNQEIVHFKNVNDLIKKIKFFLKNDKLRFSISKRNYKLWHSKYNSKNIINYIFDILRNKKLNKYPWYNV